MGKRPIYPLTIAAGALVSCAPAEDPDVRDRPADVAVSVDSSENSASCSQYLADAVLTPDGAMVVAGGGDGLLRFWEAHSTKLLWTLPAHRVGLVGIHFDGSDVVTRGLGGDVSRWTVPEPRGIVELSAAEPK
jgi:WD40 repeat protein